MKTRIPWFSHPAVPSSLQRTAPFFLSSLEGSVSAYYALGTALSIFDAWYRSVLAQCHSPTVQMKTRVRTRVLLQVVTRKGTYVLGDPLPGNELQLCQRWLPLGTRQKLLRCVDAAGTLVSSGSWVQVASRGFDHHEDFWKVCIKTPCGFVSLCEFVAFLPWGRNATSWWFAEPSSAFSAIFSVYKK